MEGSRALLSCSLDGGVGIRVLEMGIVFRFFLKQFSSNYTINFSEWSGYTCPIFLVNEEVAISHVLDVFQTRVLIEFSCSATRIASNATPDQKPRASFLQIFGRNIRSPCA